MRITALTERGDDMPNLVLAPFYAIADLTVASHQHKMPPEDSWKRPQDGGQEEEDNYKRGVTDRMWGPSVVADGFVAFYDARPTHVSRHIGHDEYGILQIVHLHDDSGV